MLQSKIHFYSLALQYHCTVRTIVPDIRLDDLLACVAPKQLCYRPVPDLSYSTRIAATARCVAAGRIRKCVRHFECSTTGTVEYRSTKHGGC